MRNFNINLEETQEDNQEYDVVNRPKHYNREGGMQCIDEMLLLFEKEEVMSYCKLNAWKYRYRAADKNGVEDLRKSDWYLNKYKELKEEEEQTETLSRTGYSYWGPYSPNSSSGSAPADMLQYMTS